MLLPPPLFQILFWLKSNPLGSGTNYYYLKLNKWESRNKCLVFSRYVWPCQSCTQIYMVIHYSWKNLPSFQAFQISNLIREYIEVVKSNLANNKVLQQQLPPPPPQMNGGMMQQQPMNGILHSNELNAQQQQHTLPMSILPNGNGVTTVGWEWH